MYLDQLLSFLTTLLNTYTLYAIGVLVVILILFYFKTKAMMKFTGLVLILVIALYLAGMFMDGVENSTQKKKALTEKSKPYDQ